MPPISRTHAFVLNNEGNYSPAGTSNTNAIANNIVNDAEVADPPGDSMSALAFSPQADFLAVGSWDSQVRIYEVGAGLQTQGRAMYLHQAPVLSVCWSNDGTRLFSGGADNAARMFDITTGETRQIAQHDAPVKAVRWVQSSGGGVLATGSWDKTIKYWDLRSANPVLTVQLPERCYAMDVVSTLMVVGTADRHVQVFDLRNPAAPTKNTTSPLRMQTRAVACHPHGDSFVVGSVEGRFSIQNLEGEDAGVPYRFWPHRTRTATSICHALNDLAFHPKYGTLATCGSDGVIKVYDVKARNQRKEWAPALGPISCIAFNRIGTILAYGMSYDWHKGHSGMTPDHPPNKLMLHSALDSEVGPVKR